MKAFLASASIAERHAGEMGRGAGSREAPARARGLNGAGTALAVAALDRRPISGTEYFHV